TRSKRDWSSDVCSSDLNPVITVPPAGLTQSVVAPTNGVIMFFQVLVQGTESGLVNISNIAVDGNSSLNGNLNGWLPGIYYQNSRSEERRVGKDGDTSGW